MKINKIIKHSNVRAFPPLVIMDNGTIHPNLFFDITQGTRIMPGVMFFPFLPTDVFPKDICHIGSGLKAFYVFEIIYQKRRIFTISAADINGGSKIINIWLDYLM